MQMNRFVRLNTPDGARWGKLDNDSVKIFDNAPWDGGVETGKAERFEKSNLLAPVVPSKVVLIGLNYHDHIKESQSASAASEEPIIFMKPSTAVTGPNDPIPCYGHIDRIDYEGELAAVIGRKIFRVGKSDIRDAIFGYTCLNDVTARNLQKKDTQWTRAKSFDGFCPIGPWVVTDIDPLDLKIETSLNGEIRQEASTALQIWNIFALVKFISDVMTLLPGDVVSTGTPKGVGPVKPGDIVKITIENIGTLENKVIAA
jgi:2-keto-4-pentenoate hydratase/2-oxohepta-3-ene-1,7-dioic acid hydratase in catechol pathway